MEYLNFVHICKSDLKTSIAFTSMHFFKKLKLVALLSLLIMTIGFQLRTVFTCYPYSQTLIGINVLVVCLYVSLSISLSQIVISFFSQLPQIEVLSRHCMGR